jgi:hypothetical protein
VLANVNGDLLTLMMMRVHQNPLDEVIAILVASNVNEWNARSIWTSGSNDSKIVIQEFKTTNLETLLDDFRSELVDAIAIRVGENMIDDSSLVRW